MLKKIIILFVLVLSLFACQMPFNNEVPGTSSDNAGVETETSRSLGDLTLSLSFDSIGSSRQIPLSWGTGTIGTGVSVSSTGMINSCYSFDGTSSGYVNIPNGSPVNFGTGDFSITCWVKTTKAGNNAIIDKRSSGGGVGYHFVLYDGHMLLQMNTPSGWVNFCGWDNTPAFNDGKWHFLAVTVDRDRSYGLYMYADGKQIYNANPTSYTGDLTNTAPLYIGKHSTDDSCNFNGQLDDVRIYKGFLSDTEVATVSGITPVVSGYPKTGSWTADLKAVHRSGSYAKYFTFSLYRSTRVTIKLNSSTVDAYLYLLSGRGVEGTQIASNDDGGGGTNSLISTTLDAGDYTLEATTYYSSRTGDFTLSFAQIMTEHVVVVVMDGARYSETWGDPSHQYIPRIANEVVPRGVVLTNFRNTGMTSTTAGHTALTTGVNQDINNDGTEYPANPGIGHYLRRQYGLPAFSAFVVTSKDKLFVLAHTNAAGWESYTPAINCGINGDGTGGYRDDQITTDIAANTIFGDTPTFMIVNLKDPDSMGHANNWQGYLDAIRNSDNRIVNACATWDALGAASNTTLFIVNDHGRHLDGVGEGFVQHGDSCEGCRHIMCVGLGPDFKSGGYSSNVSYDLRDVTATAAYLLNVDMSSTAQGRVMTDILK